MGAEQGKLQWNSQFVDCATDTANEIGQSAFQYECAESDNDLRDRITLFHFILLLFLTLLMVCRETLAKLHRCTAALCRLVFLAPWLEYPTLVYGGNNLLCSATPPTCQTLTDCL